MKILRGLPLAALGAALTLGACTGTASQGGDSGTQGDGSSEEMQQGTILNDTAPARPEVAEGAPSGSPGSSGPGLDPSPTPDGKTGGGNP